MRGQFTTVINTPPTLSVNYINAGLQVNVLDGGRVESYTLMSTYGLPNLTSELNVYGGTVGYDFSAYYSSTVNVFGGEIEGGLSAYGDSVVNLQGGTVEGGLTAYSGSVLNVLGGTLGNLTTAKSGSKVTITGGAVGDGFSADTGSTVDFSGGTIGNGARFLGNVTISSGTFGNDVYLSPSAGTISGGTFGRGFAGGGQINMSGGSIDDGAAIRYGTFNLSGGTIGHFFAADSGAVVNMSGGNAGNFFTTKPDSKLNMTGGVVGDFFTTTAGSTVTLSGVEFKLDGVPIAGLDAVGNSIPFNLTNGSALSGVLADGTPYAFSPLDNDQIADGTLKLQRASLPPVGPALINVLHDAGPLGIRGGQTIIVPEGSKIANNFAAGEGSSVVISGGQAGINLEAVGSHVSISGGKVGYGLDAFRGSTIDISGGAVDDGMDAFAGSVVNVTGGSIGKSFNVRGGCSINFSGGAIGDRLTTQSGSAMVISGGEFRLNGQLISGLDAVGKTAPMNLSAGSVLSGTLADGTPFAFSSLEADTIADGTLTLKAAAMPDVGPATIRVPSDPSPSSIRGGQMLVISDGGAIGPQFNAGWGSHVQIAGGSVAEDFEANGAEVAISGGTVEDMAVWNSHVAITGGVIGRDYPKGIRAGNDSVVDVAGGMLSNYTTIDHSVINVTGGTIDGIDVANHGVANIAGGEVNVYSVNDSTLNITGGHESVSGIRRSVVNLSGDATLEELSIGDASVANISGGKIKYYFEPSSGAQVYLSGGDVGDYAHLANGATMTVSGGSFGSLFKADAGSQLHFIGSEFRVDGMPVDGLGAVGNTRAIDVPTGAVLTGTLADGTPFTFSSEDGDTIRDGTVTLEAESVATGPATIEVPTDAAPRGVHGGQTLTLNAGGKLPDNFNAGWGSSVVIKGGEVGANFEAAGAIVNIQGGTVGTELNASAGSVVNISGGTVGGGVEVFRGGRINVAGGSVNEGAVAHDGGKLNLSNGAINGAVYTKAGGEVTISGGSVAMSLRADGGRINISGGAVWGGIDGHQNAEVNISGGVVRQGISLQNNSVINISGGTATAGLHLYSGALGNVSGGQITSQVQVEHGATLNVSGGSLGDNLQNSGAMNISGGAFGQRFASGYGGQLAFSGNDFRLDGAPIAGLVQIGNTVPLNLSDGSLLSGTLADGTPFAFSSYDGDYITDGTLTLKATALPAIGPDEIHLPSDQVPLGIRAGQTMHVTSGGLVPDNFNAGLRSTVEVAGGNVGNNFEAVSAHVSITSGSLGAGFSAWQGSVIQVSGGSVGYDFHVSGSQLEISGGTFKDYVNADYGTVTNISGGEFQDRVGLGGGSAKISSGIFGGALFGGATIEISGGSFRGGMQISSGSVTFVGNDFRVNGVPIAGLDVAGATVPFNVPLNSVFTCTLADGTPFISTRQSYGGFANGTVTLRAAIVNGPALITLPHDHLPLGVGAGQTLLVGQGAQVPESFQAGFGSTLSVDGGSIGDFFTVAGASINVHSGTIGRQFQAWVGSTINVSGGTVSDGLTTHDDCRVNVTAGHIGDNFDARDNSVVNISGGSIGRGFRSAEKSVVNVTGGVIQGLYGSAGSKVNLAGGTIAALSCDNDVLTIVGSGFRIDGNPVDTTGWPEEGYLQVMSTKSLLTGTFADGTPFAFGSTDGDTVSGHYYFSELVAVHLRAAAPLPDMPAHFNASTSAAPLGIRAEQTMDVHEGGVLPANFNAGWGSRVVITGGQVGENFEAAGADVTISGGNVGGEFDAFYGSVVNITGGTFGDHFTAHGGSLVNTKGGTFGDQFEAQGDATVNIFGTKFWLNDVPIQELSVGLPFLVSQRNGNILSGLLADGSRFKFDLTSDIYSLDGRFDRGVSLNLILAPVPEPASLSMLLVAILTIVSCHCQRCHKLIRL